jgi:hypothetical protein
MIAAAAVYVKLAVVVKVAVAVAVAAAVAAVVLSTLASLLLLLLTATAIPQFETLPTADELTAGIITKHYVIAAAMMATSV